MGAFLFIVLTPLTFLLMVAAALSSRDYRQEYEQAYGEPLGWGTWSFSRDPDPAVDRARRSANLARLALLASTIGVFLAAYPATH